MVKLNNPKKTGNKYNLTSKQIEKMKKMFQEISSYRVGDRAPELVRYDTSKGFVKGNVEIVSTLFSNILDKVRGVK
mgnify:CR=1 FL=1|jgi:hypothetical protein|tara:strand:- start:44 stop:271 length:228 start_codon:yes stop_codon:yes gene_type:complete